MLKTIISITKECQISLHSLLLLLLLFFLVVFSYYYALASVSSSL